MSTTRKCKTLPIKIKQEIILAVENGEKKVEVAEKYKLAPSTLFSILKNREKLFDQPSSSKCKGKKSAENPKLEERLISWFSQCRQSNVPLNGILMQEKARTFAKKFGINNFKASNGWLENFKRRHNITFKKVCGESATVDEQVCSDRKAKVLKLIEGYDAKNIINADETGLFYKCLPDRTMQFKGKSCHGGKLSKERITVLLAANMDGTEKLKMFVIGKSAKPRCFKNIKTFPVTYKANKKAWMTRILFKDWLTSLNEAMRKQNRSILLFIDNCPAHDVQQSFSHVHIEFLPPNTTAVLQPLDRGLIQNLKTYYCKEVVSQLLDNIENGTELKISIYSAMNIAHKALSNGKSIAIKNCFRACGFSKQTSVMIEADESLNVPEWNRLPEIEGAGVSFVDYVHMDDNVLVTETLSDNEIVHIDDGDDEFDETEDVPLVSSKTAKNSIENLRNFFMMSNVDEGIFSEIIKMDNLIDKVRQNNAVQKPITDFF